MCHIRPVQSRLHFRALDSRLRRNDGVMQQPIQRKRRVLFPLRAGGNPCAVRKEKGRTRNNPHAGKGGL